jgi:NAD-dependent SIR2 family protein deacetylase
LNITGFLLMDHEGEEIEADAHGSNIAFLCFDCGYPVLASTLDEQRGSDEEHPSRCRSCGAGYFLDVRLHAEKLYIHML